MDKELKNLALGVVGQAVDDWRRLCKGGTETRDCNFGELEHFFETDCDTYLTGTNLSAERIYNQLKKEKRLAIQKMALKSQNRAV